MVTAQHQQVVFAEPAFQLDEAGTALALLHLANERGLVGAEAIDIDIVAGAAKSAGAAEGVAFGMDAKSAVAIDNFALARVADATVTSAAHDAPHFSRIVFSDSSSAWLTVSQRCHATGSINSTIEFSTHSRRSFGSIASSSQQWCP